MDGIILSRDNQIINRLNKRADDVNCNILQVIHSISAADSYMNDKGTDLVFLDVELLREEGRSFVWKTPRAYEDCFLICILGSASYPAEVLQMQPVAFLSYDFTRAELRRAVELAFFLFRQNKQKIFVRTFGYFDVFVDGMAVMFKSAKAKELLALLIDRRGGAVTTEQIISVLWENRLNDGSSQNLCSKVVRTLQKECRRAGIEDILIIDRGSRCVNTKHFQCDMYDYLDGCRRARKQYIGEYMVDYSWAESKAAVLDRFLHR